MQEKVEILMGQDRGCRQGDPICPIPGEECVLFMSLSVWGLALSTKKKTPRLKSPGRALQPHKTFAFFLRLSQHYRDVTSKCANQTDVKAVINFLQCLSTDFATMVS
ncbi:hypothetical protein AVEN_168632-1 [Araneus ventricosus]|uniref:Uncharacterized protein n=1 Tax=Araneus ventricosus TaxID=182803 RepID=A0A4Y2JBF0_ARAVE|nr:hypothetical protein AVEN_168632-1 [Araneus ventricosus]